MKLSIEILTRGVTLERWRAIYNSQVFNDWVRDLGGVRERTIVEQTRLPDGRERRRLRVVPNVNLPGPLQRLVGDREVAYQEVTVFDPATRTARLDIQSEAMESLSVGGDVRYDVGENVVRVIFDGAAKVNVFGIGGLVERFVAGEVKARYAQLEEALQRWVDEGRGPP